MQQVFSAGKNLVRASKAAEQFQEIFKTEELLISHEKNDEQILDYLPADPATP